MTDKYCTLKELTPGSTVMLPRELGGHPAIVMGLAYDTANQITPHVWCEDPTTPKRNLYERVMIPTKDEYKVQLCSAPSLEKKVVDYFLTDKYFIPTMNLTSGCDPEIFVVHKDGTLFPAWEFLPDEDEAGKKLKEWMLEPADPSNIAPSYWAVPESSACPRKVPVYWDGAQAELAPFGKACLETLHNGTREGLKQILALARAKDPHAKLTLDNVIEVPADILKNGDKKHILFRCSESYNIYDDEGEGIPDAREYKYRCAGGHIHLGIGNRRLTAPGIEQIIRGLDAVLGVVGVSLAEGIDKPERRRTYGRAGEFRLPKHGIEYRVLSNFWLSHPAISMLVFDFARITMRFANSGLFRLSWAAEPDKVREVINNCDVAGARAILKQNLPVLKRLVHSMYAGYTNASIGQVAIKAMLNGVHSVVPNPLNIEENWDLADPSFVYHCGRPGHKWSSFVSNKMHVGA